jgi:DNA-directed RNA polymerase I, II, and III subunit RPABC1
MDVDNLYSTSLPVITDKQYKIYRVKVNQVKMMIDRGYIVDENVDMSYDTFINNYKDNYNKLNHQYMTKDFKLVRVRYFFIMPTTKKSNKIGKSELNDLKKEIAEDLKNCRHYIIIFEGGVSSSALKSIEDLTKLNAVKIEIFYFNELIYNPTEYYLTPKHELLSEEEKNNILNRNKLLPNDIPWISYRDPIARYYGADIGQMFKIYREILIPETVIDEYMTYRIVSVIDVKR